MHVGFLSAELRSSGSVESQLEKLTLALQVALVNLMASHMMSLYIHGSLSRHLTHVFFDDVCWLGGALRD